ncbi:MAG TPA: fluoride efflux transporter CrcB [Micromonosporaceae bacterium]|nr:fluoride efflux transporter CrcB [Micromonosporaceae bacterium]
MPAPAVPPAPVPAQAAALWSVLAVISAGGVAGALARYALGVAFPYSPGGLPWSTFGINVSGCLLIGVLMALVSDARRLHPLLRPFLGTGLLGGYTTFSSYIVEIQHLVAAGATRTALAYLAGTLISALAAVYAGTALTRLAVRGARRRRLAVRGRLAGRGRADVR